MVDVLVARFTISVTVKLAVGFFHGVLDITTAISEGCEHILSELHFLRHGLGQLVGGPGTKFFSLYKNELKGLCIIPDFFLVSEYAFSVVSVDDKQ